MGTSGGNYICKCTEARPNVGHLENCKQLKVAGVHNWTQRGHPNTLIQNRWREDYRLLLFLFLYV